MVDMVTLSWDTLMKKSFLRAQAGVCAPARIGLYHVHHVRSSTKSGIFNNLQADMVRNLTISDHVHHVRPPGKESFHPFIPMRLGALPFVLCEFASERWRINPFV
jgi:hypothetical protein